ncbi:MAG: nicotinate-nucleotide adenylyltransferase [Thiohalomonadales bacterium]
MIGIFGGTFNPIHIAHIKLAVEIQRCLNLDRVRMIPCGLPAHRECPEVSAEMRFQLLQGAIQGYPGLLADDRELRRAGPSYMIDTLESLRAEFSDTMVLILGIDAYNHLDSWKNWHSLISLAHIVVMRRPGDDHKPHFSKVLSKFTKMHLTENDADLLDQRSGKLLFLHNTEHDVSSTRIREKLAAGQRVEELLAKSVSDTINKQALYKNKEYRNLRHTIQQQ